MVLEKALVLLSPVEFGSLGVLLDEYRVRGTIGVDGFTAGVADIISHGEKVGGQFSCDWISWSLIKSASFQSSFFTELREIVLPEDRARFDLLVFQRPPGDGR